MKIYEIGTGYTPIPAQVAAATESVVEELTKVFLELQQPVEIIDISASDRAKHDLPILEVKVPSVFSKSDVSLGLVHKLKRVVYSVALARKLKGILKRADEKIVLHFHNQYNLFFFIKIVPKKLRSRARIAYTNHNGLWSLPWEQVEGTLKKRYFQEIEAMKQADLVFVLNQKTADNVKEHLGLAKARVIRIKNGVNTALYTPLPDAEIEKIKEKHQLTGRCVLLQVGSVYENKGQERTVRMLAPLLKEQKDLTFAYVGGIVSLEYHEKLLRTAKELGVEKQVKYLGAVSPGTEMNELYNLADLTVFVSEYEGFPLVCIESIAAGVPVVLGSDLSIDLGKAGIVCSASTLAEEIAERLKEPSAALRKEARAVAEAQYSWSSVAMNYLNAFKDEE